MKMLRIKGIVALDYLRHSEFVYKHALLGCVGQRTFVDLMWSRTAKTHIRSHGVEHKVPRVFLRVIHKGKTWCLPKWKEV